MNQKPNANEYAAFYHTYVGKVSDGEIVALLNKQTTSTLAVLKGISEEKALYRYAEGKWSIKELLNHIIDAERVFAYRALRVGRGDQTLLPGFSQDDYVAAFDADARSMKDLVAEFESVRSATVSLFQSFTDEALMRLGIASDNPVSVRALGFIILGHELHHVMILKERYLA
jgi:uncharacterized damage-inducible protein DinB